MQKKKAECPVCKAQHTIQLADGKMVYSCPSCKRTVRVRPPQKLTPKASKVSKPAPVEKPSQKPSEKPVEAKKMSKSEMKRLKAQADQKSKDLDKED